MKNTCGKTRPADRPYEVWTDGSWTWKVLKKYQADDNKPFARAFCIVTSPFTGSHGDMGDVYISEIKAHGYLVSSDYDA